MARVSRYTLTERQAAVERAFATSATPAAVARELEVHPATLYRWANETPRPEREPSLGGTEMRLVRAAQTLLLDGGYADITVERVADAAGVALRTAFHHFASKRALFDAAVDDAATAVMDEMTRRAEAILQHEPSLQQLRHFLRIAAEAAYATPSAHVLFRDVGVPQSDRTVARWHARFEQTVALLLAQAASTHALDPQVQPATAARVIAGAVRGIHGAVFEGADQTQAIRLVERLYLVVAPN